MQQHSHTSVKIQTVTHTGVNDGQTCSNTHILLASQDTDVTHTGVNDGQTCSNTHILAASQDTDGDVTYSVNANMHVCPSVTPVCVTVCT